MKKLDNKGVSAIIGVILMVAITVAIAATVYVYVAGMLDNPGLEGTPYATMSKDIMGTTTIFTVMTVSGNDLYWEDVEIVLYNLTEQFKLPNTHVSTPSDTQRVTAGDTIWLEDIEKGKEYRITLIYLINNDTIYTTTWTQ